MKLFLKHFFIMFLLVVTGCESSSKGVNVMVFSNISPMYEDAIESAIKSELLEKAGQQYDINVHLYPLSREKFSVLLSQKSGDIYITDQVYISGLLKKNGLTALESLIQHQTNNEDAFKSMMTKNEKTGEAHLYGIPIKEGIFKENEIKVNDGLFAVLPSFSKHQKEGMVVMKILTQ
ncbi:hypothetical protein M1K46_00135 [Fictibacillus sp. WQ 8-8]|uniref:hypothetical protein n=1 Tax=Fictibacillus sp. WQ 8-8 TaxID=2938788 RepID=UPI002108DA43|nr:hypothetical protein [Fictibacillus sp. WQ 8-8]MCQ6264077.1 hypothetical protein [Fictibacillus sp. WQ 8-8]